MWIVGTPKYVANKMKSKGLQRLRWYCQVCEKQCRDENGFKCHAQSESHLRQMLVVGEHAGSHIAGFSGEFQSTFVSLLSRRSVFLDIVYFVTGYRLNTDLEPNALQQIEYTKSTLLINNIFT